MRDRRSKYPLLLSHKNAERKYPHTTTSCHVTQKMGSNPRRQGRLKEKDGDSIMASARDKKYCKQVQLAEIERHFTSSVTDPEITVLWEGFVLF